MQSNRFRFLMSSVALAVVCVTPHAVFAKETTPDAAAEAPSEQNEFAYRFRLKGVPDKAMQTEMVKGAQLTTLEKTPLPSMMVLERRIESDKDTFLIAMRANGYFGATATHTITKKDDLYAIVITIDSGPVYRIGNYKLYWDVPKVDEKARKVIDDALVNGVIRLPREKEALPEFVQAPEQAVLSLLMQNGYPYPYIDKRRLVIDHDKKTVDVALFMHAGPTAFFGNTTLTGLETVKTAFIERRVAWTRGEPFDIRKITKTRDDIVRSGVIGSAHVRYGGPPAEAKEKAGRIRNGASLPMRVRMEENNHHTVGAGVAYATALGPSANVFWEDRNLFGAAERLRLGLEVGTSISSLNAAFTKPDFMGKRSLAFQSNAAIKDESLDAYDKRGINTINSVTWQASDRWSFSGGVGLEFSRIKENLKPDQNYLMLSFPISGKYDSSDDLMDPKKGWRVNMGTTPFKAMNGSAYFLVNEASAAHYWSLTRQLIWANRAKFGMIYGDSIDDIPADKRLYSGGGGSVRGYGYQMVGPLDANGDPSGGRMQLEYSTEMRYRVTETFGGVAFMDAGKVNEDMSLGGENFLYSAGVGVRYFTVAGPVRFDVAIPLNKRPQDDAYQIYISLGQSF